MRYRDQFFSQVPTNKGDNIFCLTVNSHEQHYVVRQKCSPKTALFPPHRRKNQSRHRINRNTPKPFKINDLAEINRDISRLSRPAFSPCPPDYFNRPRVRVCGPSDVASALEAVLHRGGRRHWWQCFLSRGWAWASRQFWCSHPGSAEKSGAAFPEALFRWEQFSSRLRRARLFPADFTGRSSGRANRSEGISFPA